MDKGREQDRARGWNSGVCPLTSLDACNKNETDFCYEFIKSGTDADAVCVERSDTRREAETGYDETGNLLKSGQITNKCTISIRSSSHTVP